MRTVKMVVLVLLAACGVGCLSVDSVIKVKADGTGTIEQTMLINSSATGMLSMIGSGQDGAAAKTKLDPATLFSEDKLRSEAARLGDGVSFVSSTPVAKGDMNGVTAVYAFTDFNALRVSTAMPDLEDAGTSITGTGQRLPLVLTRNAGSSVITLDMLAAAGGPPPPGAATAREGAPEIPKEMMSMLAPMFRDMRVAVSLEPQGTLVRTNATHVTGQRVTLVDVAFGELLADPSALEKMEALGSNPSMPAIRSALKGMKGVRINDADTLEIEFR